MMDIPQSQDWRSLLEQRVTETRKAGESLDAARLRVFPEFIGEFVIASFIAKSRIDMSRAWKSFDTASDTDVLRAAAVKAGKIDIADSEKLNKSQLLECFTDELDRCVIEDPVAISIANHPSGQRLISMFNLQHHFPSP